MPRGGGARVAASGWGWRHAGRRAPAVRDVSFTIEPGERVLLLGASGSGKSTLLAGLAGLLGGADEGDEMGTLLIDGERPEAQRGRIGLVLQDPDSQVVLSRVGDDVAFGCENLGIDRDEIWRRVDDALDSVGLDLPLTRSTAALSGGQKQRLALAGVLAMRPGLLLLDEPTANLDPEDVAEVRDAVAHIASDSTLIIVEHRTDVWASLMTRVIVLDAAGGLLADGPPATVFSSRAVELAAAGVWVPGMPLPLEPESAPAGEVVLSTEGLAIGRAVSSVVLRDLDLEFRAASSTVITGPNGVGKSTLALTLAGLLPERAGRVRASERLAGRGGTRPVGWRSRELLTRIGTVFQDPEHQFITSTVRDELAVGPRAMKMTVAAVDARVDELLDRLDLAALAGANPFTLSGGQKRRLSVATVLATHPAVMVLDEPTFGQDRVSWIALVGLLADQVQRGTSVIAVTHDPEVPRMLGTRRVELRTQPDTAAAA